MKDFTKVHHRLHADRKILVQLGHSIRTDLRSLSQVALFQFIILHPTPKCSGPGEIATAGQVEKANFGSREKATTRILSNPLY